MGGTKRKILMEKIEKQESRSVTFTKRRDGLYGRASELCLLCDAHIAILATPPSSRSNVSFYSFGHSSVDDVVGAFLNNGTPSLSHDHAMSRNRLLKGKGRLASKKPCQGLGFPWEKDGFEETYDTDALQKAIDEISELMNNINLRLNNVKNQRPHEDSTGGEEGGQMIEVKSENLKELQNLADLDDVLTDYSIDPLPILEYAFKL